MPTSQARTERAHTRPVLRTVLNVPSAGRCLLSFLSCGGSTSMTGNETVGGHGPEPATGCVVCLFSRYRATLGLVSCWAPGARGRSGRHASGSLRLGSGDRCAHMPGPSDLQARRRLPASPLICDFSLLICSGRCDSHTLDS